MATVALMTCERRPVPHCASNRDVIGQTKEILINHCRIDSDTAFVMLKDYRRTATPPLRVAAQKIIAALRERVRGTRLGEEQFSTPCCGRHQRVAGAQPPTAAKSVVGRMALTGYGAGRAFDW